MLDPRTGAELSPLQSIASWPTHFATAARSTSAPDSAPFSRRVRRCIRRMQIAADSPCDLDFIFSAGDLAGARGFVQSESTPGEDRLPYAPFCVDWEPWNAALLDFFNLVLQFGLVPSAWLRGVVVPVPKPGEPRCFDNWRPITLLSCLSKLFERMLLPRLSRFWTQVWPSVKRASDSGQMNRLGCFMKHYGSVHNRPRAGAPWQLLRTCERLMILCGEMAS